MKRLFIVVCAVVIGAAGLGIGIGCQGGGAIKFGGDEEAPIVATAIPEGGVFTAEQVMQAAAGGQPVMPVVTTTQVTDKGDPGVEGGIPCLPSYVDPGFAGATVWVQREGFLSIVDLIRDRGKLDEKGLDILGKTEEGFAVISEVFAFAKLKIEESAPEVSKEEGVPEDMMDVEKMEKPDEEGTITDEEVTITDEEVTIKGKQMLEEGLPEEPQSEEPEMEKNLKLTSGGILVRMSDDTATVDEGYIVELRDELNSNLKAGDPEWQAMIVDVQIVLLSQFKEVFDMVQARVPDQLSFKCPISRPDRSIEVPAIYMVLKDKLLNNFKIDNPEIENMVLRAVDYKAIFGIDYNGEVLYAYGGVVNKEGKLIMSLAYHLDTTDEFIDAALKAFSEKL